MIPRNAQRFEHRKSEIVTFFGCFLLDLSDICRMDMGQQPKNRKDMNRFWYKSLAFLPLLAVQLPAIGQDTVDSLQRIVCPAITIEIESAPAPAVTDAAELLKGAPGVIVASSAAEPGMVPKLFIDGARLLEIQQAVYVIDGVRVWDLAGIPVGEVKSIRVLRGAEAIALYGPEAASGAVEIRTRRATTPGFHADYTFRGGFQRPAKLPEPKHAGMQPYLDRTVDLDATFLQSHEAGVQYRGRKLGARAAFAADRRESYLQGDDDRYRRNSVTFGGDAQLLPWMRLEASGGYAWVRRSDLEAGVLSYALNGDPAIPAKPVEETYIRWEQETARGRGDLVMTPLPSLRIDAFAAGRMDTQEHEYQRVYGSLERYVRRRLEYGMDLQWGTHLGADRQHGIRAEAGLRRVQGKGYYRLARYTEDAQAGRTWDSDRKGPEYDDRWYQGNLSVGYDWRSRVALRTGLQVRWGADEEGLIPVKPGWSPWISLTGVVLEKPYVELSGDWVQTPKGPLESAGVNRRRDPLYRNAENILYVAYPFSFGAIRRSVGLTVAPYRTSGPRLEVRYFLHHDAVEESYFYTGVPLSRPLSLRNEGLTLSGSWNGSSGPWQWLLDGNYTRMRNRVSKETPSAQPYAGGRYAPYRSLVMDGKPIGMYLVSVQGTESEYIGGLMPRASYGARATLRYKGWGLGMRVYGWGGNRMVIYTSKREYPRVRFLRLDQFCLDYKLAGAGLSRAGLSEVRMWLSLENLASWTNYQGRFDPEATLFSSVPGSESNTYPEMPRAVLGVSLTL